MINKYDKVYSHLSLGHQWWEETCLYLLINILKDKENQVLTLEEIIRTTSAYLDVKKIDNQNIASILNSNLNYFEKKEESQFLIKKISSNEKKEIQDYLNSSKLELTNIKQIIFDKLKNSTNRNDIANGFLYLIVYPILKKATLQLFKDKFDILDRVNITDNTNPSIKKFFQIFPKVRKDIQIATLLNISFLKLEFIKKIILSILFIELLPSGLNKEIDEEFFASEEFALFINTHFLLSIEIINSTVLLEEHFNNSAESISKILVNDSYKKGNLYNDYLKTKWNSIQEKYDDKLAELFAKKEQDLWDILNDSKDVLDKTKSSIREFEAKQENLLLDAEHKLNELNQRNKSELSEYINKSNGILSNIEQVNEKQKVEIDKSIKMNENFYESVNKQIEIMLNKIESLKENTNKEIFNQSETFKVTDLKRKEKELKAFDDDIRKEKENLNRKINRKKKEKEAISVVETSLTEAEKERLKKYKNSFFIFIFLFPIIYGLLLFLNIIIGFPDLYFYLLLLLECPTVFYANKYRRNLQSKNNELVQILKENERIQNKLDGLDKEIITMQEEIDELDSKYASRRTEILNAINEITSLVGKKQDITYIENNNEGIINKFEGDTTMGDTINVNNKNGNFTGNLNTRGKQSVSGNVSSVQNAADKEKEDQYLNALAELKEEISKIKSSETERQEMKKAVQKIEEEIQSDEPDLDVVKVKAEKLVTIAERVDQIEEGVEKTSKLIDKVKNLGEKMIIYLPALTDVLKSVIPS
jgi:hypothetical protein